YPPEGRYSRNRPRVGNFSEHTWGTFLSLVSGDQWHTLYATSGNLDLFELNTDSAIRLGALLIDAELVALDGEQATP
ncbi:hypothetical protein ND991_08520, partial [Gordonia sputi]|uniref:hypothetical protein n=1 Tax=Gordonia sputi TaxID=36823 RepID=UPI002043D97B